MKAPYGWKKFCDTYTKSESYWYVPKGMAVTEKNFSIIKKRLQILFKYKGKDWSIVQTQYVKDLKKKKIFVPRASGQSEEDQAAIGRMYKAVFSSLGLAWVDKNSKVFITEIGKELINNSKGFRTIENQIERFQFYNPSVQSKFTDIKVIPIIFIIELLNKLPENSISKDEFILFVARAKSHNDINESKDNILHYRKTSVKLQKQIVQYLKEQTIREKDGGRRTSIYNTVNLNSSYALDFFGCSKYLAYEDHRLSLKNLKEAKKYLQKNKKKSIWIDFQNHKDWFHYFGSAKVKSPVEYAVNYYADVSDIANAVKTYKEAIKLKERTGITLPEKEFENVQIREKILEDFLEFHLGHLEKDLRLVKNGRQYSTLVGTIDILAEDSKGKYVVIELKKGRASDRVFGQVARYVAWLREDKSVKSQNVRAIIVGLKIDRSLQYSIKTANFPIKLYEFDFKINFQQKTTKG